MAVILTDYFRKTYTDKWYSRNACICYIFMIVAFVLPLVLVVKTHSKIVVKPLRLLDKQALLLRVTKRQSFKRHYIGNLDN